MLKDQCRRSVDDKEGESTPPSEGPIEHGLYIWRFNHAGQQDDSQDCECQAVRFGDLRADPMRALPGADKECAASKEKVEVEIEVIINGGLPEKESVQYKRE